MRIRSLTFALVLTCAALMITAPLSVSATPLPFYDIPLDLVIALESNTVSVIDAANQMSRNLPVVDLPTAELSAVDLPVIRATKVNQLGTNLDETATTKMAALAKFDETTTAVVGWALSGNVYQEMTGIDHDVAGWVTENAKLRNETLLAPEFSGSASNTLMVPAHYASAGTMQHPLSINVTRGTPLSATQHPTVRAPASSC